jgi:hypothetical protein
MKKEALQELKKAIALKKDLEDAPTIQKIIAELDKE